MIQCFDPETLKRFKSDERFSSTLIQLICEGMPADLRGDFDRMQTAQGIGEIRQYADGIALPAFKNSMTPNDRSGDVFSWDPI